MSRRLPSINALRTFETAARHLSFVRAADELSVTPAAVGFQIKQLESELGAPLFHRKHRAVELTDRGHALCGDLGSVFETIQAAWDAAHEPTQTRRLTVTGPARAVHDWVLPALAAARASQPDVRIAWDLSRETRDLAKGGIDLAIRWARAPDNDFCWQPLLQTWFTPLLRPDVARHVKSPRDLLALGLIDVEFPPDPDMEQGTWSTWFQCLGMEPPQDFAVRCADTASAVETALATGHVAIGGSFLAATELASGRLVAPFDMAMVPRSRFWLVSARAPEAPQDHDWFFSAARAGAGVLDRDRPARLVHPDGSPVGRQ